MLWWAAPQEQVTLGLALESPSGGLLWILTACLQNERVKIKVAAAGRAHCLCGAQKRVKSSAPYKPAEQNCESGIAIQPVNPHTARELRARRNGL